jgi:homogentisate 1,2-dioxygenase
MSPRRTDSTPVARAGTTTGPHGPDVETFEMARHVELAPRKMEGSIVFMIESRQPFQVSDFALSAPEFQRDYQDHWKGFTRRFPEEHLPSSQR